MDQQTLKLERQYLSIAAIGNATVACVGITVAWLSDSQAIMLDGLFNLTYFVTGLFTLQVAKLVARGDDERFPYGYSFFESLVNGIKGLLVFGVSVSAVVGAVQALFEGGRPISAGLAVGYGIFASIVCWSLTLLTRRGAKQTSSPLVAADAENWLVNAAISSCVVVAFTGIFLLLLLDLDQFVPYVDPVVVLATCLITIGVPVRMAWQALMDLLNRAPTPAIVGQVTSIVDQCLADLPVTERFVRVIQPGRYRMVLVHVVLPSDFTIESLDVLDAVRLKTHEELRRFHVATVVDLLFTTDRQWGAPLSDGGAG